jgi:hypothetical protein
MNNSVWIVAGLKAYILTFAGGLFVGFALGTHAVHADIGPWLVAALALVALVGLWRNSKRRGARAEPVPAPLPPPLAPHSNSAAMDDAQAALATLGYGQREARNAVAKAVDTLDDDADAAAIVKVALRARRAL